jgi:hypothetical protein
VLDERAAEGSLHHPHAFVAEVSLHRTMPIVNFFAKFIEPLNYERRDSALLGTH